MSWDDMIAFHTKVRKDLDEALERIAVLEKKENIALLQQDKGWKKIHEGSYPTDKEFLIRNGLYYYYAKLLSDRKNIQLRESTDVGIYPKLQTYSITCLAFCDWQLID